jgi:hypothetical protein
MRGCAMENRKPKKMGRGCNIAVKPRKKPRRRRDPLKMIGPVIRGLGMMARR